MERPKVAVLKQNKDKCKFRVNEITYLGKLLVAQGIQVDPKRVAG